KHCQEFAHKSRCVIAGGNQPHGRGRATRVYPRDDQTIPGSSWRTKGPNRQANPNHEKEVHRQATGATRAGVGVKTRFASDRHSWGSFLPLTVLMPSRLTVAIT